MKKITGSLLVLLCLSIIFNSCSKDLFSIKIEGDRIQKDLVLSSFDKIRLDMSAEVTFIQGKEQKITVSAQEGIFPLLNQSVFNDTWRIELASGAYTFQRVYITITLPTITEIYNDSSGDIFTEGAFTDLADLNLIMDGSGNIQFKGNAKHLDILIDGSGGIQLTGTANSIDAIIDGSGDLEAFDLPVNDAVVVTDGSGDGAVYVDRDLKATIRGSGDIFYKGNPKIWSQIESSGNVVNAN